MKNDAKKYQYERRGQKGARVGQAVADILSKDNESMTCEELLEGFGVRFAQELESTINANLEKYESPFYVLALTKKEYWADNIVRNWFIARQTPPHALDLTIQYPGYTKTLYVINSTKGDLKVAWSIPGLEECKSICKHPDIYSPELVEWIRMCFEGKLDLDRYDYLFR